jgi:hypothetical protein
MMGHRKACAMLLIPVATVQAGAAIAEHAWAKPLSTAAALRRFLPARIADDMAQAP